MKVLYNLYLDEDIKLEANNKITRLKGPENKGQLASLLRVLLKQFVLTPDEKVDKNIIKAIDLEYQLTTKCNKRSKM